MINFNSLSSIEILSLTLIGEARGESIEGQVAVGWVIMNRFHHNPIKYKTIHDVCLEKEQFSCWNSNDPNRVILEELAQKMIVGEVIDDIYYNQCIYVATGIINRNVIDNTYHSMYYLTNKLFYSIEKPIWARQARDIKLIGTQIFFNV